MKISERLKMVPLDEKAFAPLNYTAIYWLGAAGFLINVRGTILLIDPVLELDPEDAARSETGAKLRLKPPISTEDLLRVDAVLYTHSDKDHTGPATACKLAQKGVPLYGPYPVFHKLMSWKIPFEQCPVIRYGEMVSIGSSTIQALPADHPWQLENPVKGRIPFRKGECLGYQVDTPDGRLLFPGDTRLMEEHLLLHDVQVLALDVSDSPYHLGPEGAVALANHLESAYLLPMHYATFDEPEVSGFTDHLDDKILPRITRWEERGRILNPGQGFYLDRGKEIRI